MENTNHDNENLYLYANPLEDLAEETKRFNTPTTLPIRLSNLLLTYGDDIELLPPAKAKVNRHISYEVEKKTGQLRIVTYESENAHIELKVKDLIGSHNIAARKLLQFISERVLRDAYSNATGQLTINFIKFPLSDIYGDNNIFGTERGARKGFFIALEKIRSFTIKGHEKRADYNGGFTGIISGGNIDNNICYVELSMLYPWASIGHEYIPTPSYKYGLPTIAFDLLTLIITMLRQKTREISKDYREFIYNLNNGRKTRPITISLSWKLIIAELGLKPKLNKNGKPKDLRADLITPICDAIDKINEQEKLLEELKQENEKNFTIKTKPKNLWKLSPRDIIENGAIEITLELPYAKRINNIMNYNKGAITASEPSDHTELLEDKAQAAVQIENQTSLDDYSTLEL